jgi:hypothetical protein
VTAPNMRLSGRTVNKLPVVAPRCAINFGVRGPKMSPHQVIAVAVRLFAVWFGVYALRAFPYGRRLADSGGKGLSAPFWWSRSAGYGKAP